MGNCGSALNCTATGKQVEADPDVAGIGVLMSFVAPATIAFFVAIVGYLSESLPESTLTQLDHAFLDKISIRKSWPWFKEDSLVIKLSQSMDSTSTIVGPCDSDGEQRHGPDKKRTVARKHRMTGLQSLLFALSDQQLVIGIAIMVAGLIHPCSRSVYHFDIIAALGWFSSITHLSSLTVLRDYLINHPRTRDLRVIGMLSVFSLLIVFQIGTFSTQDNSLPIKCMWFSFWPEMPNPFDIFELIFILIILMDSYASRIGALYSPDPDWTFYDWLLRGAVKRLTSNRNRVSNLETIYVSSTQKSKAERGAVRKRLRERQRWSQYCSIWTSKNSAFKCRLVETIFVFQELQRSFLSEILFSFSVVTYGIAQVFVYRSKKPEAGLSGDENAMSFGQLVPLLLLALPLLTAVDVYFEHINERDEVGLTISESVNDTAIFFNPVAILMQEGSKLAISKTLQPWQSRNERSPSASADGKLDPSANIIITSSEGLLAMPGEKAAPDARVDDSIQLIVRADTETGLKPKPSSRAMFSQTQRKSQAPESKDRTPSPCPQPNDRRSRRFWTWWDTLFVVLFLEAGLLVFIAIALTGAAGDRGTLAAAFVAALIGFFLVIVQLFWRLVSNGETQRHQ